MKTDTTSAPDVPALNQPSAQLHLMAPFTKRSRVFRQSKFKIQKSKMIKNSLFQSNSKAFKEKFSTNGLAKTVLVQASPTKSNQIQPNPTTPPGYESLFD